MSNPSNISHQELTLRKNLEEKQKALNALLKQVQVASAAAAAGSAPVVGQGGIPVPTFPVSNNVTSPVTGNFTDPHVSPLQRIANQALQQANQSSFGSFVATDSHFGNGIVPVLPRITDTSTPTTNSTVAFAGNNAKQLDVKPIIKLEP